MIAPALDITVEIVARLKQWMVAIFTGDQAGQAEIEHEDAIFTYPNGERYTTGEHIALTALATQLDEHDITFLRVQPHGDDLAVVWLDHTLRATLRQDPFGDTELMDRMRSGIIFAMTTVWRRFDADWRLISMNAHIANRGFVPREARDTPNVITYP